MTSPSAVIGVALAGGASRRMGRDKSRLPIDAATWIEHTALRLERVCERVVIADRGRGVAGEGRWASLDDGIGQGPAAGILGVHSAFPEADLLVLACDLPAVPVTLLEALVRTPEIQPAADLVIPRWQRGIEPLCALYRRRALESLGRRVACGSYSLRQLVERPTVDGATGKTKPLQVECIETSDLRRWGEPQMLFSNLNTPQDIERFEKARGRRLSANPSDEDQLASRPNKR